ncbi:lasso peptide biosynthesis B2 protein [Achromobacter aegrifaciens]|uniref:lasso peptide biosynthesis B2 protein n=1 Tax=Achromobacter aegrifaciens TaxID=1287736 RepID=UPI00320AD04F
MPQEKPNGLVRLAHFREDLIILDTVKDKFSLIPDLPVDRINSFLASPYTIDTTLSEALRGQGITREQLLFSTTISSLENTGLLETRWKTPPTPRTDYSFRLWCVCLWRLINAGLMIKRGGYAAIIKILNKKKSDIELTPTASTSIARIIAHINKAFLLDFSNNRCLTYSLTLCMMARNMGLPAKLIVGVRTRPFFSHAWVELHGRIINDDPELRSKLSIILEE